MTILLTLLIILFLPTQNVLATSEMEIFSDVNFTNPTTKFSAGQTVYVKIESDDPAELTREVKLKDNNYRDISTFQLSREGSSPYIYKVSFAAPATSSFYSIEATIASEGSQNKLVKTIQVGSLANVNTKINVRTEVKGTESRQTLKPIPAPTATPTPTTVLQLQTPKPVAATPSATTSFSFWQKIVQFLESILKFFSDFK